MRFHIAVLPGDGIGPEIVDQAVKVLNRVGEQYGHEFEFSYFPFGGIAIDQCGEPMPQQTVDGCKAADAVLLGAVGGPKWDTLEGSKRPEAGLLGLRKALGLYANLRPAVVYSPLKDASPLKADVIGEGLDIMVVRELTGGIYFGERGRKEDYAYDTEQYSIKEIERIARSAFEISRKRNQTLCSVDKANVLESSRLWRETVNRVSKEYPEVELTHLYVDNAAMQLVRNPRQFSTIVTSNLFGDILSDEASMITGSIGMLPSASMGSETCLYEPIHGSAPDIAGQNIANPLATILSASMMLDLSFHLTKEAREIERAVVETLKEGYRTADIDTNGTIRLSCSEMGDQVLAHL